MRTEAVTFTIIQPSTQRGNHSEPQVAHTATVRFAKGIEPKAICEDIFSRCGNYPEPSMWYPWWQQVNREKRMYSLSVGAVIQLPGRDNFWVCDTMGFTKLTNTQAKSWLTWKGERSYGDMVSLNEWKKEAGLTE